MSWVQMTLVIDSGEVDQVSDYLEAFEVQAITTENAGEDEFYEVAFPGTPTWHKVRLTALFEDGIDLQILAASTLNQLSRVDADEIPITIEKLADQNWERVWLQSFKPIKVGTDLWVVPSWCEPADPNSRNIRLDPGLAFGTGTHATTHMCLKWLSEQPLAGQRVLDYGSGSGILAIAAIMAGASHADAVDIDPFAVSACEDNARRNHFNGKSIDSVMDAFLPQDLPQATNSYDLVIANILAEVILDLVEELSAHVAPNGHLLLTGILDEQADKVVAAYEAEFNFTRQYQDHWVLLVGQRSSTT